MLIDLPPAPILIKSDFLGALDEVDKYYGAGAVKAQNLDDIWYKQTRSAPKHRNTGEKYRAFSKVTEHLKAFTIVSSESVERLVDDLLSCAIEHSEDGRAGLTVDISSYHRCNLSIKFLPSENRVPQALLTSFEVEAKRIGCKFFQQAPEGYELRDPSGGWGWMSQEDRVKAESDFNDEDHIEYSYMTLSLTLTSPLKEIQAVENTLRSIGGESVAGESLARFKGVIAFFRNATDSLRSIPSSGKIEQTKHDDRLIDDETAELIHEAGWTKENVRDILLEAHNLEKQEKALEIDLSEVPSVGNLHTSTRAAQVLKSAANLQLHAHVEKLVPSEKYESKKVSGDPELFLEKNWFSGKKEGIRKDAIYGGFVQKYDDKLYGSLKNKLQTKAGLGRTIGDYFPRSYEQIKEAKQLAFANVAAISLGNVNQYANSLRDMYSKST